MRGVNPSTTPAAVSLTASIRRNSFTATISSASTFQNGDGVVIYGAGASHAMSTPRTPTVTQSIARVMTGAGDVVTGPTGATTYNYKIIWRDKAGGLTAASPAGTTTTGQASLGKQTVNITSMSRAADGTATVTTAAAHTLVTGAMGARRSPSRCKRLPRAARPAPPTPTSSCNTACSSFGGLPGSCLGMLEDYDKYSVYYAPDVERSKIESRSGDIEHDVTYFHDAPERIAGAPRCASRKWRTQARATNACACWLPWLGAFYGLPCGCRGR